MTTQEQIESIQLLVDEKISDEDLKNIEERYKSKKLIRNDDTPYTQEEFILFFQYALSLIQSKYTSDWPKGRQLMQDLYEKSSDAGEKRDYLFYCAIAELKMKNYSEATKFAKSILYIEPFNHQAKALVAYIEKKQDRDLLIGAGVLGGAALVGTVLLGVLGGELINDMLSLKITAHAVNFMVIPLFPQARLFQKSKDKKDDDSNSKSSPQSSIR